MKLIEYLPEIIQEIREYRILNESLQKIINDLWEQQEWLMKSYYLDSETPLSILEKWEEDLGINALTTEDQEERLFRLRLYTATKTPYTLNHLKEFLQEHCQYYHVAVDYEKLILEIKIGVESWNKLEIITSYVDKIAPANLVRNLIQYYNIWNEVKEKSYEEMKEKTYQEVLEDRSWIQ